MLHEVLQESRPDSTSGRDDHDDQLLKRITCERALAITVWPRDAFMVGVLVTALNDFEESIQCL